jgi:agmatinase
MRYGPADSSQTPRFTGPRTFMRLPNVQTTDEVDVAVLGIPIDDAVSYRSGARFGPEASRHHQAPAPEDTH